MRTSIDPSVYINAALHAAELASNDDELAPGEVMRTFADARKDILTEMLKVDGGSSEDQLGHTALRQIENFRQDALRRLFG